MSENKAARIAAHLRSRESMGRGWGIEIEEAGPGYARIACDVSEDMLNGHRTAHGGAIFTLADTAFAYACNSHGFSTVAHSATINFLSPARSGERLIVEAREIMLSGRSGSYAVTVRTGEGRPVASFQGLSRSLGTAIDGLEN